MREEASRARGLELERGEGRNYDKNTAFHLNPHPHEGSANNPFHSEYPPSFSYACPTKVQREPIIHIVPKSPDAVGTKSVMSQ